MFEHKPKILDLVSLYLEVNPSRRFKTSRRLLLEIALSKKALQYELDRETGESYRTVLRHLKILQQLRFIELDSVEPSSKGGKDKNIWRITSLGCLRLLMEKESIERMDTLAAKYQQHLPLVLANWDYFKQKGIKDAIVQGIIGSRDIIETQILNVLAVVDSEEYRDESEKHLLAVNKSARDLLPFLSENERDEFAMESSQRESIDTPTLIKSYAEFDATVGTVREAQANAVRVVTFRIFIKSRVKSRGDMAPGKVATFQSVLKANRGIRQFIVEEMKLLINGHKMRLREVEDFVSGWDSIPHKKAGPE